MKILFLLPRFHTNHIEIIKLHQDLGHDFDIHVKTYGKIEDYSFAKPVLFEESFFTKYIKKIINFKTVNNSFYLPKIIKYYLFLKKQKYDYAILRVHGFIYTYIISLLLKLNKINIIYYQQTNIDLSFLNKNKNIINIKKIEFYFRLSLFKAKWITPLKNQNIKESQKNIFYLPFIVQLNSSKLKFENFNILTIGKFQERKNHLFLIKSLKKYFSKYNIKLTIVGENSNNSHQKVLDEIKKYNKKYKLENNVKIYTNIDYKLMRSFYKKNNLFILGASREPASISLLEAMGNGLPSICADDCGTSTYILENYNGFLFKSNNLSDLQLKLEKIFNNIDNLKLMSENAYDFASKNISRNNYIKYFNEIIK
jgi:glycosyltransferase involved in cell wall biosynthesis